LIISKKFLLKAAMSIKNTFHNRKLYYYFFSILVFLFFFYLILFFADLYIQYLNVRENRSGLASVITRNKLISDIFLRKKLRNEGYQGIVYTSLFGADWSFLALKYNVFPLGGLPNTKTYLCNEGYGLVNYTSDKYGFRNNNSIYDNKIKFMLVGDSFIHGSCVDDDHTIPSLLNKGGNLSLNMGMVADSPLIYASRIKIFTPVIKPEFLIVNFYSNDNLDYLIEEKYYQHYFIKNNVNYLNTNGSLLSNLLDLYNEASVREIETF